MSIAIKGVVFIRNDSLRSFPGQNKVTEIMRWPCQHVGNLDIKCNNAL